MSPIPLFKEAVVISVSIYRGTPSNHLGDFSNLFTTMEPTLDLVTGGTVPWFHFSLIERAAESKCLFTHQKEDYQWNS